MQVKRWNWWLRATVALLLTAYLLLAPAPLLAVLRERPYYDWLAGEREAESGVLTVWHVVDFKPYQGSLTAYLESIAAVYEKEHSGVYIQVTGMDATRMQERLERGERPDVWSFSGRQGMPAGVSAIEAPTVTYAGELANLTENGQVTAVPYCLSGYYLLGNAVQLQRQQITWPTEQPEEALLERARQAEEGDFKAGQAPVYIGDARMAGDLSRKTAQEGFTLLALPLGPKTDQVQYLAMHAGAEGFQRQHGTALIESILLPESQSKLTALGLIPAVETGLELQYANSQMQALYAAYRAPQLMRQEQPS